MKVRKGFVSNSSSCNFVLWMPSWPLGPAEVMDALGWPPETVFTEDEEVYLMVGVESAPGGRIVPSLPAPRHDIPDPQEFLLRQIGERAPLPAGREFAYSIRELPPVPGVYLPLTPPTGNFWQPANEIERYSLREVAEWLVDRINCRNYRDPTEGPFGPDLLHGRDSEGVGMQSRMQHHIPALRTRYPDLPTRSALWIHCEDCYGGIEALCHYAKPFERIPYLREDLH